MENPNQVSVTEADARSVKRDKFTRRGFLGIGSTALAIAGIAPAIAHTPPELVMAHLRIDKATFDAIPKEEFVIMPG